MQSNDIFVVKRPFKSNGQCFEAGQIVDPAEIRLFRNKVNEGKVVRLSNESISSISLYIQRRTGKDISSKLQDIIDNGIPAKGNTKDVSDTDVSETVTGTDVTETKVEKPVDKPTGEKVAQATVKAAKVVTV